MKPAPYEPSERIERLISRFLDEEASRGERRELHAAAKRDPQIELLLEDALVLDKEFGRVLRAEMGRSWSLSPRRQAAHYWGRLLVGIAAAGMALAIWPSFNGGTHRANDERNRAGMLAGDTFGQVPMEYEHPGMQPDVQKSYLLVPGRNPNEVVVIEVQRVKARPRPDRGDF